MGCCFGCCKDQDNDERIPINNNRSNRIQIISNKTDYVIAPIEPKGELYYQSIVDEAQEKFLNNSKGSRINRPSKELSNNTRQAFLTASSTSEIATSPPNRMKIDRNSHPDLLSQSRSVINILSEPINIPTKIDMIADDVAELITSHTYKVLVDESNSTLVPFAPVNVNR
mmetsp:Transcript_17151/g.15482  ORF Transcript_17151/g.15482 Transcript_17151/m.15482 type:complete len:170 (+) Transcript_17151:47-556(+)